MNALVTHCIFDVVIESDAMRPGLPSAARMICLKCWKMNNDLSCVIIFQCLIMNALH